MTLIEASQERYRRAIDELGSARAALYQFDRQDRAHAVGVVQKVACNLYGVTVDELIGVERPARIAGPRHLAIWFLVSGCSLNFTEAGAAFNRDRATAHDAFTTVENRRTTEKKFLAESAAFHTACTVAIALNAQAHV